MKTAHEEMTVAYCKEPHRQPTASKHDTVLTSTPGRLTFSRRDINRPHVLGHTHFHTSASLLKFRFRVVRYPNYVGDSNENLKSATKNRNIARFSCKLATLLLMV
jgi:hypothetical protein